MNVADALDSWVCQSCLVDAANVSDTDTDDLDFNFVQESEETDTTNSVNHVCPVCDIQEKLTTYSFLHVCND